MSEERIQYGQKPYHSLDWELKKRYGHKLYKISLEGGMTCPNRDGKVGYGGCIFCSEGGSGEFAPDAAMPIPDQIEAGIEVYRQKTYRPGHSALPEEQHYIAYFQAFTNTYAPVDYLKKIYMQAISHPQVDILSIGTRPDCIPDDVLDLLDEINHIKPIWVELGLQTMHDSTARLIRRGYDLPVFEDAFARLKSRGIEVIVHVILGLPGETKEQILGTIDYLSDLKIDGIKLQLMHVLKGTDLADIDFPLFSLEEYVDLVIKCMEHLDPSITIHRITGDGPADLLIAPLWSLDKRKVLNTIHHELKVRDTWQGRSVIKP